jgi:hypothetical protein
MNSPRPKLSTMAERWLTGYVRQQTLLGLAGAVASLLCGIVVLFITYWLVLMLMWLFFDWLAPSSQSKTMATWIVMGLLFVAYGTANWQHLDNLQFESRGRLCSARVAGNITGSSFMNLAAGPQTAHSFVKIISVTLLLGPGLVVTCGRLLVRTLRLARLDTDACARLIAAVLKAGRKVPLEELAGKHPNVDWERVLPQLCLIDGVVILRSEPVGVVVTDGLREAIAEWRGRREKDQ